jgi:hypothetical protein
LIAGGRLQHQPSRLRQARVNRTYLSKLEKGASDREVLQRQPDLASQSAKTYDYRVVVIISSARRLGRSPVCFCNGRPLAFAAQLLHAGADSLEIVGSSGVSHVSSLLGNLCKSHRPVIVI